MPRPGPEAETVHRLWTLLRLIPRRPHRADTGMLKRQLDSEGIDVTPRSIQRDLQHLAARFHNLHCDERSKPYGWAWDTRGLTASLRSTCPAPSEADARPQASSGTSSSGTRRWSDRSGTAAILCHWLACSAETSLPATSCVATPWYLCRILRGGGVRAPSARGSLNR